MLTIGQELAIFVEAVLSGIIVFAAYDVLRVFRRLIRHGIVWISLEDLIFWSMTGIYLFVQIYKTSDGSIRWFFVIGVVAGMILFAGITRWFIRLYGKMKKGVEKP